jgi:tetratricopeptide (TPR) repeat protein
VGSIGQLRKARRVLGSQGKLAEALDSYQQSLKIRQILAEQDKTNTGWQRDLSVSYAKVGEVLEAQGKLTEALDAYQQYLTILKRLAEQDKTNTGCQRDLIVSLHKVGTITAKMGDQLSRILRAGPRPWSYQILKRILFTGTPQ